MPDEVTMDAVQNRRRRLRAGRWLASGSILSSPIPADRCKASMLLVVEQFLNGLQFGLLLFSAGGGN